MSTELENLIGRYRSLGIDRQIDYDKFYLYSIITHSTIKVYKSATYPQKLLHRLLLAAGGRPYFAAQMAFAATREGSADMWHNFNECAKDRMELYAEESRKKASRSFFKS